MIKIKKAVSLVLAAALLLCGFAGCKDQVDEDEFVKKDIVLCDLLGLSDAQIRAIIGDPYLIEQTESNDCFEFTDYGCWIYYGISLRDLGEVPDSCPAQRIYFGTNADEVIDGITPRMTYERVCSSGLFSGMPLPTDIKEEGSTQNALIASSESVVEYHDRFYHVKFIFSTSDNTLTSGMIELVDENFKLETEASTNEEQSLTQAAVPTTAKK